ncbi:MAG: hypothetical protein HYR67_06470 [Bacteroidetes bacterium]|nr:hypothetical protein [Bacteroidota bacterium]
MKRILVIFGLLSLLSTTGFAQFKKGDNLLNIGFGLNSYYSGGIPFSAAYEYGVSNLVSVGGGLDYLSYHYGVPGNNYRFTALYLGFKASYHFNQAFNINDKKWDIYGGGTLGYRSFTWGDNYVYSTGYYNSGLFLGIHAGARYYFAPKTGGFLEVGALGSSNIRLGVTFRF